MRSTFLFCFRSIKDRGSFVLFGYKYRIKLLKTDSSSDFYIQF